MALPPPVRAVGGGGTRWQRGRADTGAATSSVDFAKLGLSVHICETGTKTTTRHRDTRKTQ